MTTLRIATRRSELAMAQAGIVRLLLTKQGFDVVLVPLSTSGDEDAAPRAEGDGKDRWIDAIVESLRTGAADLAVHSAKDLPAEDPDDLVIGAVPERADAHDVLVAGDPAFLDGPAPRAGRGSARRRCGGPRNSGRRSRASTSWSSAATSPLDCGR
jgi:hydroxymethylbilane synthase